MESWYLRKQIEAKMLVAAFVEALLPQPEMISSTALLAKMGIVPKVARGVEWNGE